MNLKDLTESRDTVVPADRYNEEDDKTKMKAAHSRKVRLTLEQINKLRRMQEVRRVEEKKQEEFFKVIYGTPPEQAGL